MTQVVMWRVDYFLKTGTIRNMKKTFYITTTLPYVNADPHIGFASEIVLADVRARFERLAGFEVVFNTGTDEHGQKIYQKALEQGRDPQAYVDEYAQKFDTLRTLLNLSYTHFVRTTDAHHITSAQELWRRADANGYIYKKEYRVKYCVGCELEKTDSELDHGECPLHPGKPLEIIEEENYFFKWSAFQDRLLSLYETNEAFVYPKKRQNEIRAFVERGLEDFSISRIKEKMPWGIPVPGDEHHVMYVWFDALTNYISTLGWPEDGENFEKFWGILVEPNAIQIAGKDNLRQQSAMWQAMLMSADLPTSKQIFINGFIGADGQKMSKSIGNVIHPQEMVDRFGIDGTRYLLLTKGNFGEDNDTSWEKMTEKYNADLANGLGNLVSRVAKLAEGLSISRETAVLSEISAFVRAFEMNGALERIMESVGRANKYIEETKPWDLKKTDMQKFEEVMRALLTDIRGIAKQLEPFLPETSERIFKMLAGGEREILFQRISE